MSKMGRTTALGRVLTPVGLAAFLAVVWFGWAPRQQLNAAPESALRAVTDQITYNVGEAIWLRLVSSSAPLPRTLEGYVFTVRFQGEQEPVAGHVQPTYRRADGYWSFWVIPSNARAGRYEVGLRIGDPKSHELIEDVPQLCTFVVHREVVRIDSVVIRRGSENINQSYFTSGDDIICGVGMTNLTERPLTGLRLEFSERYWPWIVQQTQKVGTGIVTIKDDLALPPRMGWEVGSSRCAAAPKVDKPTIKQYAAVVWDHDRKNVYAIGLSPLVFINPPGVTAPRPYPTQYIYPNLGAVNTTSYRHFHPEPFGVAAIHFETQHTLFASGSEVKVRFSLSNPTDVPWHQVSARARLLGPDGKELASHTMIERSDLDPHGPVLKQEVDFMLPKDVSGLYRVRGRISDDTGQTLAENELELGVNPLPNSVVIFCAHEDDDGTQMGFIRALVENGVPLHVVYYTSGDAGSCDRYFQHSCGPAEALNFGAVRMQEARAALGHLGVPAENILFLGLPDGGTGKIWFNHLNARDPYLAVLLASDHAPYDGLFQPNLPFARDAVVDATEEIIKRFQPAVIFTVHPPEEGHIDHIVNNYFVVKALQELLRAGAISPETEVRVDRISHPKEHPSTPYHYEDHEFYVSGEAMSLAQEAGWFYQSQGGNREEENLNTWDKLPRSEGYRKVLDWKEHEGWNEQEPKGSEQR